MRKIGITRFLLPFLLYCIFAGAALFAQDGATVAYVEGDVDLRDSSGDLWLVDFGDFMQVGETLITGRNGFAELEPGEASVIRVSSDTVFTLTEEEVGGKKKTVMSTPLGSVAYKFSKAFGTEPKIATASVVAGVRGTEFTVYAGSDGSSLILVDEGEVAVTSKGETVALTKEEGVEVAPGEAPGQKFNWKGKELDFSSWDNDKFESFKADPLGALEKIERQLYEYQKGIAEYVPLEKEKMKKANKAMRKVEELMEKGEEDKAKKYRNEIYFPLMTERNNAFLNLRYYALSALSLRRYVMGKMFVYMQTKYINESNKEILTNFLEKYEDILDYFEMTVVPRLVEADI